MPKPLPIGIQSFPDLITGGFLYVDKTRWVYEMVRYPKGAYFLSRPRRFGKSLLLSTLEAIFKGHRDLFKGLWIDSSDYAWNPHPVIRIDFSQFRVTSTDDLPQILIRQIRTIAEKYRLNLQDGFYYEQFSDLITQLSAQGKVVVLVDEYDKPIIDNIDNLEQAIQIRDVLKGFYEVLKGLDEYLRFVFLTGVSKFSKVGVFSGLNHLEDITMSPVFSALPGITQEELTGFYQEEITAFAAHEQVTEMNLLDQIKHWYNGFCFSANGQKVYNPFSLLLMFKQRRFANFWFETGTPTFLIRLLKTRNYDIRSLEDMHVDELSFSSYEVDDLKPEALLLQTGYLTIRDYDPVSRLFRLSYPNFEVKNAFMRYLLNAFSPADTSMTAGYLWELLTALRAKNITHFFEVLQIFFAGIPYDIQIKQKRYYQTIFYLIFRLMGLHVGVEVRTSRGRIDAVVELDEGIFLFEFKLGGDAQTALTQIHERGYADPFAEKNKPIHLIGAVFGTEGQGIVDWKIVSLGSDQTNRLK